MWGLAVFLSAQAAVSVWLPQGQPGNEGGGGGEQGCSQGSSSETAGGACGRRKGRAYEHMGQVRVGSPSSGDFRGKSQENEEKKRQAGRK